MSQKAHDAAVKVGDLRARLAEVLEHVEHGERVLVERYNQPTAAIVPICDYHTLQNLGQAYLGKEDRMAHRIVVSNISGGEGKTSITRELAFTLAHWGYRVALFDTDPQASLTKTLGFHNREGQNFQDMPGFQAQHTILSVFVAESGDAQLNQPLTFEGVDVWVSNDHLYEADQKIAADLTKIGNFREAVNQISDQYDFIFIDTKPGLTPLLNATVAAADHLIVPMSGTKGFENLDKIIKLVKGARLYAPEFKLLMFVPNRVRGQTNAYKAMLQLLENYKQLAPVSSQIRDSILMMDAQRLGQPLIQYRPSADLCQDIQRVARELLAHLGMHELKTPSTEVIQ